VPPGQHPDGRQSARPVDRGVGAAILLVVLVTGMVFFRSTEKTFADMI